MCEAMTFPWDASMPDKLRAKGVTLAATPTGETEYDGIGLSWEIAGNSITINVTKKPFFVSCGVIQAHLTDLFHWG